MYKPQKSTCVKGCGCVYAARHRRTSNRSFLPFCDDTGGRRTAPAILECLSSEYLPFRPQNVFRGHSRISLPTIIRPSRILQNHFRRTLHH